MLRSKQAGAKRKAAAFIAKARSSDFAAATSASMLQACMQALVAQVPLFGDLVNSIHVRLVLFCILLCVRRTACLMVCDLWSVSDSSFRLGYLQVSLPFAEGEEKDRRLRSVLNDCARHETIATASAAALLVAQTDCATVSCHLSESRQRVEKLREEVQVHALSGLHCAASDGAWTGRIRRLRVACTGIEGEWRSYKTVSGGGMQPRHATSEEAGTRTDGCIVS